MGKDTRREIEIELIDLLAESLSKKCYFKENIAEDIFLKKEYKPDLFWRLKISLCNKGFPYNFLDGIGIEYNELTSIIYSLLDKPLKYSWHCIAGEHVRNYWPPHFSVSIDNKIDLKSFVSRYIHALNIVESDFFLINSDVNELIRKCQLFYTKWPKGMGPFDTALCLISFGLKINNSEYIQAGVNRIYEKRSWGHADSVRYIPFYIRNKMIIEGKAKGEILLIDHHD